MRTSLKGTW